MHLEQFISLAKSSQQSSKALPTIIEKAMSHPHVFIFGELIQQVPIIQQNIELIERGGEPSDSAKHFNTLYLFAYGNWQEYFQKKNKYIELNPKMIRKL